MNYKTKDGKEFSDAGAAIAHAIMISPGDPHLEPVGEEAKGAVTNEPKQVKTPKAKTPKESK